nr:outer membrane protein porin [Tanacetum cinerariifolium]
MEGREGVVRRWWSGAEMGISGTIESGGNSESKLASQDLLSNQKEYNELRTSYNALEAKFDSLKRDKGKSSVTYFSKPKVSVSEKVYTGESSKSFTKKVS